MEKTEQSLSQLSNSLSRQDRESRVGADTHTFTESEIAQFQPLFKEMEKLIQLQQEIRGLNESAGGRSSLIEEQMKRVKSEYNSTIALENLMNFLVQHGLPQKDVRETFVEVLGIKQDIVDRLTAV